MTMRKIKIGFSTRDSLFANLIRFFSRSSVSHTYVRISMHSKDNELIFQASGLNVNMEGGRLFESHSKIVKEFEIEVSDDRWKDIEFLICDSLGKPYSMMQVVGMLWVLACRPFGVRVSNPFSDGDHSYVCVELVAKILNISDSEDMTPQDLYDYIVKNNIGK